MDNDEKKTVPPILATQDERPLSSWQRDDERRRVLDGDEDFERWRAAKMRVDAE